MERKGVNADAKPDVTAVPPREMQERKPIVCARCGGKALWSHTWKDGHRSYYACANKPQCVDPETLKPWVTKVAI